MTICSLLPSATEMLFALGLGEQVVGVSHECDFPPEARRKVRVIDTVIRQEALSSDAIDQAVREALQRRAGLYRIDVDRLRALAPDLIVTQELCDVCAVDTATVAGALGALTPQPTIISLHPHTMQEMLEDIARLGEATGRAGQAQRVVQELRARLAHVQRLIAQAPAPRVACLEWLKPLMACGHWVPQQVEMAGGREVLGRTGRPSRYVQWEQVRAADPDIVILMPCGFSIERTTRELALVRDLPGWNELRAVGRQAVYLVNGPAYFNRSGPRLVDGVECLAALLHPDLAHALMPQGAAQRMEP